MSWPAGVDPVLREAAERVCSQKQLEVVQLLAAGYGMRRIGLLLGISRGAVRDRAESAQRKMQAALEEPT